MSVATAETRLIHEPAIPEEMPDGITPRGLALSVALHIVLGTLLILGLPRLFDPPIPEDLPVAVQLVTAPPKPTEKVEVPKPKEKPAPPQQIAKNESKAEQKKYGPGQFEALLRNLAAQPTAPSPDAPPQRPRAAAAKPSSQPRAPL